MYLRYGILGLAALVTMTASAQMSSRADYPVEALKRHQEGRVGMRLTVSAMGVVAGCTVVQSSGSPYLDEDACRKVTRQARFEPGKNAHGEPVESQVNLAITYKLPR